VLFEHTDRVALLPGNTVYGATLHVPMARITVVSPAEKALAAKGGWISKKKVPGGKAAGSREGKKGPGGVQGKPREQAIAGAGSGGRKSGAGKSTQKEAASISHPYDHDPADDCETSFQAYSDVAAVLKKLAQRLGKSKEALCIWDPYYCNGKTKVHLRKLGFQNVVNENEDCYAMMEGSKPLPGFDVLVTSPPYSRDHIERLLKFTRACGKPFLLLLPDYVHRKSYYPGCRRPPWPPPVPAQCQARVLSPFARPGCLVSLRLSTSAPPSPTSTTPTTAAAGFVLGT
jgi:hypothetical protein